MRLTPTGLLQVHTSLILADDRISSQMGPRRWRATVGLAGRESTGWFFGFKLHLVFNHQREIVALKLTPGNLSDTGPVPDLTNPNYG
jgi:hypothetical protein